MRHTYCTVSECEQPSRQGRIRCDFHEKRWQRGQSLTAPKAERLSANARLLEAAILLADAEGDSDYEKAARNVLRAARHVSPDAHAMLIRMGLEQAKKRGVRLGRPPAVTTQEALALLKQHGTLVKAAQARGVSRWALWRALGRVAETMISQQAA